MGSYHNSLSQPPSSSLPLPSRPPPPPSSSSRSSTHSSHSTSTARPWLPHSTPDSTPTTANSSTQDSTQLLSTDSTDSSPSLSSRLLLPSPRQDALTTRERVSLASQPLLRLKNGSKIFIRHIFFKHTSTCQ